MPNLLVVHHSPSPRIRTMLDAVVEGTRAEGIEGVSVRVVEALHATAEDVMSADGYVLGTPANLGYMSGALKHFFDTVYNDAFGATAARPFGVFLHGHSDTDGAALAITKITTGLEWRLAQPFVSVVGDMTSNHLEACWELGAVVAAGLMQEP